MPLLILLIYGLNSFVKILTLDVRHISLPWKLCSGKNIKLSKYHLILNKKYKTHDKYWWCMAHGKSDRELQPSRRTKLSKKAQERQDKIKKNYMKLISGEIIGNSNCIGTNFNFLILIIIPKELNPFLFFKIVLH